METGSLSRAEVDRLVNSDFQGYYSEFAASHFAARVWTNNAWVAALCIAFGVLGLPVIYLLFQNILNVALTGALMVGHGRGDLFFGLILPHGMLELTAVFVAAGAGLRLFWAWVEPGPADPRARRSPTRAGPRSPSPSGWSSCCSCRGVIEAFVTPSALPTWARLGDRRRGRGGFPRLRVHRRPLGVRRGATGDVDAADAGDTGTGLRLIALPGWSLFRRNGTPLSMTSNKPTPWLRPQPVCSAYSRRRSGVDTSRCAGGAGMTWTSWCRSRPILWYR